MEPASSSDEDSSSASSHSSYYASDSNEPELTNNVASLDDLPSEDSCGEELDDESDQDFDHNDHVGNDLDNVSETKGGTIKDLVDERRYGGHLRDKQQIQKNKKKALKVALSKISSLKKQNKSIRSEKDDKSTYDGDGESHNDNDDNKLKRKNSELGNKKKKRSKHAPTEVSSKRRDYFNRGAPVLQNSGVSMKTPGLYKPRDPRMQSLSGYLDETLFDHRYGFLEDIQDKEISDLREKIKAQKMTGKKGRKMRKRHGIVSYDQSTIQDDERTLSRMIQQRSDRIKAREKRQAKQAVNKKIRDEVAEGKRGVYYLKRKDRKKMEMEARFDQIRERGGDSAVDKAIAKRRKKNKAKDQKLMPE